MAIQVSGTFGSRQEEAQRLGRLLRPKANGREALFYTAVSRDTLDTEYAAHRQRFLAEQGLRFTALWMPTICSSPSRTTRMNNFTFDVDVEHNKKNNELYSKTQSDCKPAPAFTDFSNSSSLRPHYGGPTKPSGAGLAIVLGIMAIISFAMINIIPKKVGTPENIYCQYPLVPCHHRPSQPPRPGSPCACEQKHRPRSFTNGPWLHVTSPESTGTIGLRVKKSPA